MNSTNDNSLIDGIQNNSMKIFFFIMFLLLILYIGRKIRKKKNNCEIIKSAKKNNKIISSFYSIDDLIKKKYFQGKLNTGQGSQIDYNYKLKDFYIKTAYNCFCSGYFRNDYVDKCALINCASYGVRALDMQIFSINNEPIIGSTSTNINTYKESYNKITLKNGLNHINNSYFQNDYIDEDDEIQNNLKNDPLFLILRLHYGSNANTEVTLTSQTRRDKQLAFYDKIYNTIMSSFQVSKFASTYFKSKYGTNYDRSEKVPNIDMNETKNKIFIFVILNDEPTYDTIKQSKLDDIVNLYGNDFSHYRNNELSDTDSGYDINKYKAQNQLTYCMPAWSSRDTNYDFTKAMKKGTQYVGMNYQNLDNYLMYYNQFFINQYGNENNDITSPYIKKPDHMIDFPLKISIS